MSDSSDDNWLKIGTTFQKEKKKDSENREDVKVQSKKQKKKQKQKKKEGQIEIKFSQKEIDLYYDKIIEDKQKIDLSKGFIYKHEISSDLLSIQLLPFGNQNIYDYGHMENDVPKYRRIDYNLIIGLKSDDQTKLLLQELSMPIAQKYQEPIIPRFYDIPFPPNSYTVSSIKSPSESDFIPYTTKLEIAGLDYKSQIENQVIKRAIELQSKLQQDVNDLEAWKELLALQEKQAELQGYAEISLIAQKRLAILDKLEKASEVLADHPWVLAYKIFILQNLQLKNEEFEKQIEILWDDLFTKYQHIQSIWILTLDWKLKRFSATAARIQASSHFSQLKNLILQSKRPQMINFYKKIYLELVQQIVFYEWEMGYKERAIGIYQGLYELNIFGPKEYDYKKKMEQFQKYWEETEFKIGEGDRDNFIGKHGNVDWRPLNATIDNVEENPEGVVLYEDIESYLHIVHDADSKLKLLSGLLEQLEFPQIGLLPRMGFYEAFQCLRKLEGCLQKNKFLRELIYLNDILIKFDELLEEDIRNKDQVIRLMLIRRIMHQLKDVLIREESLVYLLVLELSLKNKYEQIKELYKHDIYELQECDSRIKLILKTYGEKYLLLWIVYSEFQKSDKIYEQIIKFSKSKKQKLIILYYWIQTKLVNQPDKVIQLLREQIIQEECSDSMLILKLKQLFVFELDRNKINNQNYLDQNKTNKFFPISKKWLYLIFYLTTQTIIKGSYDFNVYDVMADILIITNTSFADRIKKDQLLQKLSIQMEIVLLNCLRLLKISNKADQQEQCKNICQIVLQYEPQSLVFFSELVKSIQKNSLYFQKIPNLVEEIQLITYRGYIQSPQTAWISLILVNQAIKTSFDDHQLISKLTYIYEFIKVQSNKQICQIYCEHYDQEKFDGLLSIVYNYVSDKILLLLQNKIQNKENLIKQIYDLVKKYPFSIYLYELLLNLEQQSEQTLNILKVIQEKELRQQL